MPEHDDYPGLPVISEADRRDLDSMHPRWFLLPQEELAENDRIRLAIRALVARYLAHLGPESVERVTETAMVGVRDAITEAMNAGGDVTTRE